MKKYQYDALAGEEELKPSRSQKKRDSTAMQDKALELINLSVSQLKELEISDELIEAIQVFKATKSHEARRRQMQYIGKLMRV